MEFSPLSQHHGSPAYDANTPSSRVASSSDEVKRLAPRDNRFSSFNMSDQAAVGLRDRSSQKNKRKAAHSFVEVNDTGQDQGMSKRLKLEAVQNQPPQVPRDRALLPSDMWHRVFTFLPPRSLGALLQEIDLLLSSTTPSSLIPGFAFVLVTQQLQAIPSSTLTINTGHPKLETTKLYSASSIAAAKEQLSVVQDLGTAAVEEWFKGLDARGKELRNDASRWEKWAMAGGLALMCQPVQTPRNGISDGLIQAGDPKSPNSARDSETSTPLSAETKGTAGRVGSTFAEGQSLALQSSSDNTHEEAAALKALRRAEIERRAMLLDPPLPPNIIVHMPCFQAAIQITATLDDNAWITLKPRLLSQRADAERNVNSCLTELRSTGPETKDENEISRKVTDQDWDDIQGPVRARISKYADEVIRGSWNKGRKVNKENSPRFAAGVLLSVRSRFYADVAQDAADALAAGQRPVLDPQEGPFTQKLTLENMKWVFDVKIKQHTESHRRELFLCNGCESHRFYGLEGVIQHYAAKHTKALSLGNVVVHWRAEWPEQPIFKPNGRPTKSSRQIGGTVVAKNHAATAPRPLHGPDTFSRSGSLLPSSAYHFTSDHVPSLSYQIPHIDPYNLAPSYNADASIPRAPYTLPNFAPPGVPQFYPTVPSSFGSAPRGPQGHSPNILGTPYAGQPHITLVRHGHPQPPCVTLHGMPLSPSYATQLEDLARIARVIWNSLSTARDLPGPLRVYITIHHVVKRFRSKFADTPSLRMFNDGLSNNKDMRPVRNINGLRCKSCTLGLGPLVNPDRTTFSLPQLVNHFENQHMELQQGGHRSEPGLDWTQDMILMPDVSEIPDLKALIGGKGHKFNLVNEAVPWVFKKPNRPSHQPGTTQPLSGLPQPIDSDLVTDYTRQSYATHAGGSGAALNAWPDSRATQDPPSVGREQQRRDSQPSMEYEVQRCATIPSRLSLTSYEEYDPGRPLDSPTFNSLRQRSWGAPSVFDEMDRNFYYESGHPGGGNKTAQYMASSYPSGRIPAMADGNHHGVREQPRAPGPAAGESRHGQNNRFPVGEEERTTCTSDQARSVRPRPSLEREQMPPQNTRPGSGRCATIPQSTRFMGLDFAGPLAEKSVCFGLTAALESHLAQDRDAPAQNLKYELFERGSVQQECRPTARDARPSVHPIYPEQHMDAENLDDARHRRFTQSITESHGICHPGDPSEALSYNQISAVIQHLSRSYDHSKPARYAGVTRPPSAGDEESYEIVHVRDAEREYLVRRPILCERAPPRVLPGP
ncbi:hypothetical protein CORC01_00179 [Colletotrichum orchidophilum]|uniref:DUF7892 domain-containing protein n=1 Tax=Colletotrichum orchidophilum TaxID=1209926 RepID=A0A1G4BST2_9PEZI|nr:uncharacterized protein CORC01_00179 [Colletotrichum orchidophilum]OHF04327.1 hypothetical protein CORC01_00179 [Colletotrichum orchidophilum]